LRRRSPQSANPSVAAHGGRTSLAGLWPLSRGWVAAQRGHLVGVAALGGVLGIAALSYWWTRAPLYNPSSTVDPWLYTALFVNFDEVYAHFRYTYYAARLPWIVPGRIAYSLLPVDAAYWVLHALSFCGGVAALFFLVRRHAGLAAAVVGAATLALSPIYWNAQYWDYIDGVTSTYFVAGLCFGLPLSLGYRRAGSLFAAGAFFAAAVTTNLFAAVLVVTYPIAYLFVQPTSGLVRRLVMLVKDGIALLVGAAALVVALGLHARANGGPFRFYQPQIDLARSDVVGASKIPGYEWLRSEPKVLVPLFLIAVAIPLLGLGRRQPGFRFAAASVGALTGLVALLYGWEFLGGGGPLDYSYYFSYFAVPIALGMAAVAALTISLAPPHWSAQLGAAVSSTVAAAVALVLIYRNERVEWIGRPGARISAVLLAIAGAAALGAVFMRHTRVGAPAAAVAVGAIAFASHFAINSSTQTFTYSVTRSGDRDLYHAALDNLAFVKQSTDEGDPLPAFWYRGANPDFTSIQSMYFYAYTAIDWKLPRVTRELRARLASGRPKTIVMLCETRRCDGAAAALRRAGHPYVQHGVKRIARGRVRLWVVVLRNPCDDGDGAPDAVIRDGALLRAPPAPEVYAYWRGRKHWIVSLDVLSEVFSANALRAIRDVAPPVLERMPSGRRVTSKRVWAEISAVQPKRRARRPACSR
jgi:hypothetical protein